jgi:hypothetical protein
MKTSTYRIRLTRLLVLGAIVAGTIVSAAAAADVRPPDVADAATALNTTPAGLKAYGERWEGIAEVYRGLELAQSAPSAQGLKADGLRWQGIAQAYQQLQSPVDRILAQERGRQGDAAVFGPGPSTVDSSAVVRPPDVTDAVLATQYGSFGGSTSSFDWGDWAIGLGAGLGMALIFGGALIVAPRVRRTGATATG